MTQPINPDAEVIRQLYLTMPDARQPPWVGGACQWGLVEGNSHWKFCEQVVAIITALSKKGGAK